MSAATAGVRTQSLAVLAKHARSFRIASWFLPAGVMVAITAAPPGEP